MLYHRTQAAALAKLELDVDECGSLAIEEVDQGLKDLRQLFEDYDATEQFEEDELILRLVEFKKSLQEKYEIEGSLSEQLALAIENEDYERAAELRDEISVRNEKFDDGIEPKLDM